VRDRLGEILVPVQVVWGRGRSHPAAGYAEGLPSLIAVVRMSGAGDIVHMARGGRGERCDEGNDKRVSPARADSSTERSHILKKPVLARVAKQ
jgi:hypothetical protein